jgi:dipeptidase E
VSEVEPVGRTAVEGRTYQEDIIKLLLTSGGIKNPTLNDALVGLLGKPIEESSALCIPTAIYPFSVGPTMAYR